MYCPQCGANNIDGAQFCRTCGANLSLVPKALSGELREEIESRQDEGSCKNRLGLGFGIKKLFSGLGFIVIAVILMLNKEDWGLWLLIPGFIALGKGVAEMFTGRPAPRASSSPSAIPAARGRSELPPARERDRVRPVSVTEGTTRRLEEQPPRGT
jgi:hypothetical protein